MNTNNQILCHINYQHEYRSFIKAIFDNNPADRSIISANVHNNLFDIIYETKPKNVILPSNEYTQEFHDFITEYNNRIKIFLYLNNNIENEKILDFWNKNNVICIGSKEKLKNINLLENQSYLYDKLYDNTIFYKQENINKNSKIAVFLSNNDEQNEMLLSDILYPKTKTPLVLFNSATYKKYQNVGFITTSDACKILNTYDAIIDSENQFLLESVACGIPSIDTEGDLLQNINLKKTKTHNLNINTSTYDYFVKNTFLPTIKE